jgi:hypothetical protein
MREADPVAVELNDPSVKGRDEAGLASDSGRRLDQAQRWVRESSGSEQVVTTFLGQLEDASANEFLQRLGNGQGLSRLHRRSGSLEHPNDLDRVERIPARCFMYLGKDGSRENDAGLVLNDAVQRFRPEWAYHDLVETFPR